jgi:hypothetical protein
MSRDAKFEFSVGRQAESTVAKSYITDSALPPTLISGFAAWRDVQ